MFVFEIKLQYFTFLSQDRWRDSTSFDMTILQIIKATKRRTEQTDTNILWGSWKWNTIDRHVIREIPYCELWVIRWTLHYIYKNSYHAWLARNKCWDRNWRGFKIAVTSVTYLLTLYQWRSKVPKSGGGGHTDTWFMYLR